MGSKQSLPPRNLFTKVEVAPPEMAKVAQDRPVEAVKAKPKGGRPALYPDKPWEAEGISRMTWYRRRKSPVAPSSE